MGRYEKSNELPVEEGPYWGKSTIVCSGVGKVG
jgi:hypothetical protein